MKKLENSRTEPQSSIAHMNATVVTNREIAERASSKVLNFLTSIDWSASDASWKKERVKEFILRAIEESQHAKSDNDNSGHSNLHFGNHPGDSKLSTPASLKVEESHGQQEPNISAGIEQNSRRHTKQQEPSGDDTRELRAALRKCAAELKRCSTVSGDYQKVLAEAERVLALGEPQ